MADGPERSPRRLRYLEPDQGRMSALVRQGGSWSWGIGYGPDGKLVFGSTPVALCARCTDRFAEDPTRDIDGNRKEDFWFESEEDKVPICFRCEEELERRDTETKVLELLESKLGLAEKHRDALRSFIETIFTDPAKILRVEDLDNRVRNLEKQTDDLQKQTDRIWTAFTGAILALLVALAALVVSVVS